MCDFLKIAHKGNIRLIRRSYKKQVLKYHPDKTGNSESEQFLKLKLTVDALIYNIKKSLNNSLKCDDENEIIYNFSAIKRNKRNNKEKKFRQTVMDDFIQIKKRNINSAEPPICNKKTI